MRVNVVQGRKSISWANSVLPAFMAVSGCVTPGIRPEPHFAVQIDTTLHRSESPVIHGFQRFVLSFNRTVVILSRYTEANVDQRILLEQLNLTLPPQPPPRITAGGQLLGNQSKTNVV